MMKRENGDLIEIISKCNFKTGMGFSIIIVFKGFKRYFISLEYQIIVKA